MRDTFPIRSGMWNTSKGGNKYGNRKATVNGRTYHSELEAGDALWLRQLEKEGTIRELKEQVRYRIFVGTQHICDSIVDFQFTHKGKLVWYETKGFPTDVYLIKKKLILATLPEGEIYLVNAKELMEHLRGRASAV